VVFVVILLLLEDNSILLLINPLINLSRIRCPLYGTDDDDI
jgi:hypothetical protein